MSWLDTLLSPLYWVVSWLMRIFHSLFSPLFGFDAGLTWVLVIVALVVLMRILLIPLFVRQIRASRNMAILQPKIKELQKKYGHDRERMGQEMMKLYKETGTNPMASCLPILAQSPIFIALFRVLQGAANGEVRGAGLNQMLVDSLREATIFGARISDVFLRTDDMQVRIVALILIICMVATTFTTQRQLMRKNMPPEALTGQYAKQQKVLLYVLPLVFAVGGVNFPIGVLIYWFTTNLWTMGQQFWVIRRNPAPGSEAYKAWEERKAKRAQKKGLTSLIGGKPEEAGTAEAATATTGSGSMNGDAPGSSAKQAKPADSGGPARPKRVQPQRVPRSKRKK